MSHHHTVLRMYTQLCYVQEDIEEAIQSGLPYTWDLRQLMRSVSTNSEHTVVP
jgi:transposase